MKLKDIGKESNMLMIIYDDVVSKHVFISN